MPVWGSRRHVFADEVMVLMASTAFHGVGSVPVGTAANPHGVRMAVIALPRIIPPRVTIHAAGVTQDGKDGLKRSRRSVTVTN
jgi:hypothetical protein